MYEMEKTIEFGVGISLIIIIFGTLFYTINNYKCSEPYYDVCVKKECMKMPNYALNYVIYGNFNIQSYTIDICKCLEWERIESKCYKEKNNE